MPLFSRKKERTSDSQAAGTSYSYGTGAGVASPAPPADSHLSAAPHQAVGSHPEQQPHKQTGKGKGKRSMSFPTDFKYGASLSKTQFDIGGLPINVFGYDELTPVPSRASATPPPPVCVVIHMHGRTHKAEDDEPLSRHLYDKVKRCQREAEASAQQPQQPRDLLVITFDARNHGHRKTNPLGQKSWKEDNKLHAMDLYAMVVGGARDVSFLIDFLPAYLFPHDERTVDRWVTTGTSLGGHTVWHVLASKCRDEPEYSKGRSEAISHF